MLDMLGLEVAAEVSWPGAASLLGRQDVSLLAPRVLKDRLWLRRRVTGAIQGCSTYESASASLACRVSAPAFRPKSFASWALPGLTQHRSHQKNHVMWLHRTCVANVRMLQCQAQKSHLKFSGRPQRSECPLLGNPTSPFLPVHRPLPEVRRALQVGQGAKQGPSLHPSSACLRLAPIIFQFCFSPSTAFMPSCKCRSTLARLRCATF